MPGVNPHTVQKQVWDAGLNGGPKDMSTPWSLAPVNVPSFGKRVFADVIKDLKMRSPWITQVGPNSRGRCPCRDTQREGPAAITTGSREAKKEVSPQPLWGAGPAGTWIQDSGFRTVRDQISVY